MKISQWVALVLAVLLSALGLTPLLAQIVDGSSLIDTMNPAWGGHWYWLFVTIDCCVAAYIVHSAFAGDASSASLSLGAVVKP